MENSGESTTGWSLKNPGMFTIPSVFFLLLVAAAVYIVTATTFLPTLFPSIDSRTYQYEVPEPGHPVILQDWKPENGGFVQLHHGWTFTWGSYLQTLPSTQILGSPITLTGVSIRTPWTTYTDPQGNPFPIDGFATYQLIMELPPEVPLLALRTGRVATAARFYWNGEPIAQLGNPGTRRQNSDPIWISDTIPIPPAALEKGSSQGIHVLTVEVSNFHDTTSGLASTMTLSTLEQAAKVNAFSMASSFFMMGLFLIMSLYHIFTYLYRKTEIPALMFGLICSILALRILAQDDMPLSFLLPDISFTWMVRINFLTFTFLVPPFVTYLSLLFPYRGNRVVIWISLFVSALYSIAIVGYPTWIFGRLLVAYQLFAVALALFLSVHLVVATFKQRPHAKLLMLGFLAVFTTMILDIARANNLLFLPSLVPLGIMVFVFCQSLILISRATAAMESTEELSRHLTRVNQAMVRFIPQEFLAHLQREDITQVQLGDCRQLPMTIMSGNIQNFTALSDKLTAKEMFQVLNSLMSSVVPIIREHRGYIDHYMGEGILALFPQGPPNAVNVAIEIQKTVQKVNRRVKILTGMPIQYGIAIHSGDVTLGTLGEESRMDGTVVSQSVNLTSRIQELTKIFNSGIIISEQIRNPLGNNTDFSLRDLGSFFIKGKSTPVQLFEVFDCDSKPLWTLKRKTLRDFERAVYLANHKQQDQALEMFRTLAKAALPDSFAHAQNAVSDDHEKTPKRSESIQDPAVNYYLAVLHKAMVSRR